MRAADLSVLDTGPVPVAIRFASRLNKGALAGLSGDELVWTSSGTFAGQLRLVPLLPGVTDSRWSQTPPADPPAVAGAVIMPDEMLRFRRVTTGEQDEIAAGWMTWSSRPGSSCGPGRSG